MTKRAVAKRRGAGEDSLYQRADGTWVGAVELPRSGDGRRNRKVVKAQTKKEVMAKLDATRALVGAGVHAGAGITVGAFLTTWLDTVIAARVGDLTQANYHMIVTTHLIPGLGKVKLAKLTAEQVDELLAEKAETHSRSTVKRMRALLVDAFRHAERRHLVVRNVAALSVLPKTKEPTKRSSLTTEQVKALLAAAEGDRLEALLITGLNLALRPGELTGLLWEDIDLGTGRLAVTGSIKIRPDKSLYRGAVKRSTAGERTLGLPPVVVTALRAHWSRQATERLAAGKAWTDEGMVFTNTIGAPLSPEDLERAFRRLGDKAGVENMIPYLLRHTGVSLLIDNGASIEEVADLTGDDPATLYRHYRHKVRPVATVAAERMPSVLA